jgi:hypothetical protein
VEAAAKGAKSKCWYLDEFGEVAVVVALGVGENGSSGSSRRWK